MRLNSTFRDWTAAGPVLVDVGHFEWAVERIEKLPCSYDAQSQWTIITKSEHPKYYTEQPWWCDASLTQSDDAFLTVFAPQLPHITVKVFESHQ